MRWIIRLIGFALVLVIILVGSLFLIPAERVAQIAADQLRTITGRNVEIRGDVALSLWPVLGASVGELEVGNAPWSEQGPMLTAQNASLGIDAAALLQGAIRITHVEATAPTIRLESRADGRASWVFSDASGAAEITTETSAESAEQAFSIDRLVVTDATLIYDGEGAERIAYSGVDLSLDWPERLGPAKIKATLRPAGSPVSVSAEIAQFSEFLAGSVTAVSAELSAAGDTLGLTGNAGLSGEVAGKLTLKTAQTDGFLTALGLSALDLPRGLGRTLDLATDLTLTADRRLFLRGMTVELGAGNRLAGDVDLTLDGVPNVTAQLSAGALDLTALSEGESAEPAAAGWPTDGIDASGLSAFNGQIALAAQSIDLGTVALGTSRLRVTNDRSRMVVGLREVQAYGGAITGEFVMNNRSGLSVGGNLQSSGLQVQGLLSDFAEITSLTGSTNASLQFLGVGESMDQIMRSLRGQGAVEVTQGTIQGFNLDQLMRTGQLKGGTTVFDSLTASYTIEGGNLNNSDLFASLRNFEARGEGRIGLGAQDIDYLFTPKALKVNKGKGLAIPVRIVGPWADPKIKPDLEAALDLNLDAEKERLEKKLKEEAARAEQELKEKLRREEEAVKARLAAREAEAKRKLEAEAQRALNVQQQQGQSLEDAIEKKLENEVGGALKKLFD